MSQEIPLSRGKVAIVDDEDFGWLMQWKWSAHVNKNSWYAVRSSSGKNSKRSLIYMHREILNAPQDKDVDHRDGDGLNNRRGNIRLCECWQNLANKRIQSNNTSGYKGVCYAQNKWRVDIKVNGKRIHLGAYNDAQEAARAYDIAALEHFGEFANLNFPNS